MGQAQRRIWRPNAHGYRPTSQNAPLAAPLLAGEGVGGEVSELPLKQNDYAMDALRYALHTALGRTATRATDSYLALYLAHR